MDALGFTCLITLDEAVDILEAPLRRAFACSAPRSTLEITPCASDDAAQAFMLDVDGHKVVCAMFEGAMPEEEYVHGAANSIFWLDATASLADHGAFLVLSAPTVETAHGLVRAQAIALTRLAAALCETLPASGLYWAPAGVFSTPEAVARAAGNINRGRWPVDVWVGWEVFKDKQSNRRVFALRSRGAARFLGFELQMPPFEAIDNNEPMRILMTATAHLIGHGSILRDGQEVIVKGERKAEYRLKMGADGNPGIAELVVMDAENGGIT